MRKNFTEIHFLSTPIKTKFEKTNQMVLVLKKGAAKNEIKAIEEKLYEKKLTTGFNAAKYNGALPLLEDPLTIQKQLRNEWERNFS